MLKLFLQRVRFKFRNLFAKKIIIPADFKSFEYAIPKYHELLVSYLLLDTCLLYTSPSPRDRG